MTHPAIRGSSKCTSNNTSKATSTSHHAVDDAKQQPSSMDWGAFNEEDIRSGEQASGTSACQGSAKNKDRCIGCKACHQLPCTEDHCRDYEDGGRLEDG